MPRDFNTWNMPGWERLALKKWEPGLFWTVFFLGWLLLTWAACTECVSGGVAYGDGITPEWNREGSAVCPNGYDYHAHSGLCRPQRY
jgi:hypothetical protein